MRRLVAVVLVLSLTGAHGCERVAVASSVATESAGVPRVPEVHAPKCPRDGKRVCVDRWRGAALRAGLTNWSFWSCIIWRESGGNPRAFNPRDPAGGSRGLTQINGVHVGWLRRAGIISSASDLYNPVVNLRAAKALHRMQPWAWQSTRRGC